MDKIYLGTIVSTHGIKGELKIKSNFEYKKQAFKIGNKLLINDKEYTIKTYRMHKNYDMVTLDNYDNINQVLFLLKNKVFISRNYINKNIILDEELLNYSVIIDKYEGTVKEIFFSGPNNKVIKVVINNKEILIPFNEQFIKKIKDNKIYIELIDGMII